MPPNSKSSVVTASDCVTLMRLKEEQQNSTSTTDLNNNCLKTDDHLPNQQVHLQFKSNNQDNDLNRTKLDSFELKELNNNVNHNLRLSSPISPKSTSNNHFNNYHQSSQQIHRQSSPTQQYINNHSKCNGVCVISNEPKSCLKKQHRQLTINHSNGLQQKIQIQLNGNPFSPTTIQPNTNVTTQPHSPLVPSYLSNSSKYTGYSTYGKLKLQNGAAEHLPNASTLCIDNLQTKTKIYNFKVVIIGDMAAGKTSYIRKLTQPKNGRSNRYNYYMATKGVEAKCKLFEWNDNTLINLEFWEIGGQENYVQMADMFMRDAFGAILMFDASNKQSLDSLLKWKQSLDNAVSLIDGKPIPTVLVANKCDLDTATSWLLPETLDLFCKRNNILTFFYASVRKNMNLENICYDLIAEMLNKYQRKEYKNVLNKPYNHKKSFKKFQNLKCSNCTIL